MINTNTASKLNNLPTSPGVYLFKNKLGKVIYIGKAKILRNRIRSYFHEGKTFDPKLYALVAKISDFEWIITDSEIEALILEANLVKEYKPRYNVNLKDDKSFPYIRVTNEEFPRIFPTRKIVQDGSRYFGPYTDAHSMRGLLKAVRKIFPIRSCNYKLDDKTVQERKVKLCLDYHIQRCPGPCEGLISKEEYWNIVKHTISFIEGKDKEVITQLKGMMKEVAENEKFEKAARIRDQINAIEMFRSKQKVVTKDDIDRDVIGIACEDTNACGLIFKIRDGKIVGRYHFYLTRNLNQSEQQVLQSFLQQYYIKVDFIPSEIFIQHNLDDQANFNEWLTEKRGSKSKIIIPQRGDKQKLVKLAVNNAKLLLEELKLQKLKQKQEKIAGAVSSLQEALNLPKAPKRIEAFDISNISGSDPVASMVSFFNGKPNKSNYRRFKIKSVEQIDDFAMMNEVVFRRYRRLLDEKSDLPDLVLIDGGKGQLSSAVSALQKLGLNDLLVIALAKRLDEIFIPGISDAQNIPKHSAGLKMLQQIRDESHRFAVTYHRKLRGIRQVFSELDEIPGIGDKRRKLLLENFGSIKGLKKASLADLKELKGLPEPLAESIYQYFHQKGETKIMNSELYGL